MTRAYTGEGALSPEVRQSIARLAHDLRHSAELIDAGTEKHGSYTVPWNVLSWSRDVAERGAERLAELIGPVCKTCDGVGIVDNPDAVYVQDRDTGNYETNDAEEIDCPTCGGTGFPAPDFECEDCIGMKEHGCYCAAMGASRPGGPKGTDEEEIAF